MLKYIEKCDTIIDINYETEGRQMIAVIDYGAGNLHSVKNSLDFLGVSSVITRDSQTILDAD